MDGQFGLDFKSAGENRKRFYETAGEHPIARQNVGERAPEQHGDEAGE